MRVGLIGTGVVGRRVARELVARAEVTAVVLLTGTPKDRARLSDSLGPKASVGAESVLDAVALTASGVDLVVLCTPDEVQPDQAREALAAGCHVVSLADSAEAVDELLGLDDFARELGRHVVVGAGMSPGWSTVLTCHAATLFDEIDEVSIAVTGSAGPACHERRTRATRTDTQEWRDGEWVDCAARSAPELVWFPDPLSAIDCARGDLTEAVFLRRVLPSVPEVTVKVGRPTSRPLPRRVRGLGRSAEPQETGGIRIAVSGRADGQPATVVYGMLSPPAAATAVLVALIVGFIAGESDGRPAGPTGVRGAAELLDPVPALRAAAGRGVRGLVYDGMD